MRYNKTYKMQAAKDREKTVIHVIENLTFGISFKKILSDC